MGYKITFSKPFRATPNSPKRATVTLRDEKGYEISRDYLDYPDKESLKRDIVREYIYIRVEELLTKNGAWDKNLCKELTSFLVEVRGGD